jgi:hypothetical protein
MLAGERSQAAGRQSSAPVVLAHEPSFVIGDTEVRPATREIVNGRNIEVIEPRVMQVLVALHRAKGAVA